MDKYHGKNIYLTEALTLEANAAVDQAVKDGKPFYLYMSHYGVHSPYNADPRFLRDKAAEPTSVNRNAAYASMIQSVDKGGLKSQTQFLDGECSKKTSVGVR